MSHTISLKRIYIDRSLEGGSVAENILQRAHGSEILWVDDPREVLASYLRTGNLMEKSNLLVHRNPASFLSTCPGTDGMICCNYFVINLGMNCIYDCHYCFLQSFLNQPLMTMFGNMEDLYAELDRRIRGKKVRFRIGTGEYSDSLALDPIVGITPGLVEYFAGIDNALLELKTKSASVEELLDLDHRGHTVVAWSLNPPRVIRDIEEGTASLEERLDAALAVQRAGYRLALHFDPVVHFDGWEKEYGELIEHTFDRIDPHRVAWISLGGFRYSPGLKEIIQTRFPEDTLTAEEMVQGSDGKYRYFKLIREEMYRFIKGRIECVDPDLFVYMCMETQPMWQKIYGFIPDSARKLDSLFERRRCRMEGLPDSTEIA